MSGFLGVDGKFIFLFGILFLLFCSRESEEMGSKFFFGGRGKYDDYK